MRFIPRFSVLAISVLAFGVLALGILQVSPLRAATCRDPAGFEAWLANFKREAAAQGLTPKAIGALDGISFDPAIIAKDRGQHVFRQSFEKFSGRLVSANRLRRGASLMKQYASTLSRIEQTYGVPGPVILAIWGLETNFGADNGNIPVLRALATLAYDCRRTDKFQAELMDALRLLERGDLPLAAMRGDWAGELGQTQFLPSSYLKYAVDFGGGRNLIRSAPDALASTANYLKAYGWRRGAGWNPGEPNFAIIQEWNKAEVYSRTIAYFATRLAGGR